MKLYFTCPEKNGVFSSDNYSLGQDYRIIQMEKGGRSLEGMVALNSPCPLCGQEHIFSVKDVICPLDKEKNE